MCISNYFLGHEQQNKLLKKLMMSLPINENPSIVIGSYNNESAESPIMFLLYFSVR